METLFDLRPAAVNLPCRVYVTLSFFSVEDW
jgi:hypothetical protein